jgi:rhodanese-related sulfurtransferase
MMTLVLCLPLAVFRVVAQEQPEAIEAMEEYFDFVDYGGGTIFTRQIPSEDWQNIFIVDTRSASQYEKEHIPGAVNIEWRQVLARRSELPRDKPVLLYCNTGSLSAQAGFALRLAGHENVRILLGGIREWQDVGGFDAYKRAMQAAQPDDAVGHH